MSLELQPPLLLFSSSSPLHMSRQSFPGWGLGGGGKERSALLIPWEQWLCCVFTMVMSGNPEIIKYCWHGNTILNKLKDW